MGENASGQNYRKISLKGHSLKWWFSKGNAAQNAIDSSLGSIHSLKLTAKAPEKWGLGDKPFLLGRLIFRGELLALGRVVICPDASCELHCLCFSLRGEVVG